MKQDTMDWPTMEELEVMLFHQLQEQFAAGLKHILEAIDRQIMEQRDKARFRLKDGGVIGKALDDYDEGSLLTELKQVGDMDIPAEKTAAFSQYVCYLQRNREHLRDYREVLHQAGLETEGMRPMGSAEAQMRVMAKRTKNGGYSWSKRGVRAMLKTIIRFREGWGKQGSLHRAC